MLDHTWLWQSEELSDVRIRLVAREADPSPSEASENPTSGEDPTPGQQPACGEHAACGQESITIDIEEDSEPAPKRARVEATPCQQQGTCVESPAHGTVLGSASEYWKARLLRWRGDNSGKQNGECYVLEETFNSAAEVEAARSILQHAYTGKLPDAASVPLLMQMAVLADKWQMPNAMSFCLTRAAAVPQLSQDDIKWLLQDGLPDSIIKDVQYQTVQKKCSKELLRLFGRAQVIMRDDDQLQSFCDLSLRAVQLWAEQDQLKVDSENTVAVLFTYWWEERSAKFTDEQKAATSTVLTSLLRVGHLTQSFVWVVEQLPWFKPTQLQWSMLRVLHGMELQSLVAVRSKLPSGWAKPPHAEDDQQVAILDCSFTRPELEQLHKDAATCGHVRVRASEYLYWRGYTWSLWLDLPNQQSALRCVLQYHSALPEHGADALPPVVITDFVIRVQAHKGPRRQWNREVMASGFYSRTLLGVHVCAAPRSHSFPPDNMWVDGKLQLQVTFKDLS